MTAAVPIGPFVTARDADGSEFFLDANGLAWRADRTRVAELDSVPIAPATLDRGDVLHALTSMYRHHQCLPRFEGCYRALSLIDGTALSLGFTASEWSAAIASADGIERAISQPQPNQPQ